MGWKLRRMFGLKFDLLAAYGEVLEKHCNPIEPIEVLPASKNEIKTAIFDEVFKPEVLRNKEYRHALMVSFMSLANFQSNAAGAIKVQNIYSKSNTKNLMALAATIANSNHSVYEDMQSQVSKELEKLGTEWQWTFAGVAKRLEDKLNVTESV